MTRNKFCCLLITFLGLLLLAGSFSLLVPQVAIAEISISVTGDGVANPVTFSQAELEAMEQVRATYSTINSYPTKKTYLAEGVKLSELLKRAGILPEAQLITVKATDGYKKILTCEELDHPRYYYPGLKENHVYFGYIMGNPEGAIRVENILALKNVEGSDKPGDMDSLDVPLLVIGQRWITEQTNEVFVKKVATIEVSTRTPAKWENPAAQPAGGTVPIGTMVKLSTSDMNGDNIHYTTDGSDPTVESPIYNWVKLRWWGSRADKLAEINKPIAITGDTTIKAIAIGPGKNDSDIVSFHYQCIQNQAPDLVADFTDNVAGQAIDIIFVNDTTWKSAITKVCANGAVLSPGEYSISEGKLTIKAGVLNQVQEYLIVVQATGYTDATVKQKMAAPVGLTTPTSNQAFKRGEQVTIKGTVVGNLTQVKLTITDPNGEIVCGPEDIAVVAGKFETSFTPGSNARTGTYMITLEGLGMAGAINGTFTVQADSIIIPPVGDVVLTISGSGVAQETKLTLAQLEKMKQYQQVYSAINTWPTKKFYVGEGVRLRDLLDLAGMTAYNGLIKFTAADGFTATLTVKELLNDTHYYFPGFMNSPEGHIPGSSAGRQMVEPLVALVSAEGTSDHGYMNDLNSLQLMLGQRAVTEQNAQLFMKNLTNIEVLASSPSRWDTPKAEPSSGEVPVGTLVKLSNANMDDDKIYYTTDGTIPTINSPMYNWIANRWWSSRSDVLNSINRPIEIKEDITIKAVTIGPGKLDSDVATFSYQAKKAFDNKIEKLIPGIDNTISLGSEFTMLIPANALKEAVKVKIEKMMIPPAVPDGLKLVSSVYECSMDGKSNYSFTRNITLSLKFDPDAIGKDKTAAVHYYNETSGEWINIGGTVTGNTITVEVDHFTKFAVMVIAKPEIKEKKLEEEPEKPVLSVKLLDINGHWAQKNIEQLVASGVLGGYPDGTFKPNNTMTRAEFVTMLVKAFKLENKGAKTFSDTTSHWAKDYIAGAVVNGIVSGYNDDSFGPDDLVTREQMAVMIARVAKLHVAVGKLKFIDSDSISSWAREGITAIARNGIMKGYPDNTIKPQGNATRAEAVTVIVNTLNLNK